MQRRQFLGLAGAGLAARALGPSAANGDAAEPDRAAAADQEDAPPLGATEPEAREPDQVGPAIAMPCGLYCGVCPEYLAERCKGICKGSCPTGACVRDRGLDSCADCEELPCTKLIMLACDPIYLTGAANLANLRRRRRIGTEAWIAEQAEYWADERKRERWAKIIAHCFEQGKQFE
jgi:hypothetical protein